MTEKEVYMCLRVCLDHNFILVCGFLLKEVKDGRRMDVNDWIASLFKV